MDHLFLNRCVARCLGAAGARLSRVSASRAELSKLAEQLKATAGPFKA